MGAHHCCRSSAQVVRAHSRHERPAMASAHIFKIQVSFTCIKCEEESIVEMPVDGIQAAWLIRNKQRLGWVPEAKKCQEEETRAPSSSHSWVASTTLAQTDAPWPDAAAVPPARLDMFTAMAQAAQGAMQGRGQTDPETEARILTAMQADVEWINQQEGYWGDPSMVRCLGHRIHGNKCEAPLPREKTANALCKTCKRELTQTERDLRASRRM